MASSSVVLVLLLLCVLWAALGTLAAEHRVGDNVGWVNPALAGKDRDFYEAWEDPKKFFVGDTLLFVYNRSQHNVLQVRERDYKLCNTASPIAKHEDGNTRVLLNGTGDWNFICGFPGHCPAGQKLTFIADAAPPNGSSSSTPSGMISNSSSSVLLLLLAVLLLLFLQT